ncbi:sulfotransferase [Pseudomonas fluorescens]
MSYKWTSDYGEGMQRFHFISGLPRSGSTLLSAILLQNPRFHAGMTSPVGSLFTSVLEQCSAGSEFGAVIDTPLRRRLLRGLFDSFYADQADTPVIFDTNRQWCSRQPALRELFPEAKTIACVRNVAWVMDSLERLYRANPFENTKLFNDEIERNTVYSRCETLAQRNRLVGFAWTALKEAYYGENADSLLIVDYDLLSQAPDRVMRLIYDFIGEPWFEHDFKNLAYDAPEFDQALGVSGLHKVKRTVALEPRRTILPPDLFDKYAELSFWHDGSASAANVIRMKADAAIS